MTKEEYVQAVDKLFDKATALKVKLDFNSDYFKPERLDCLWHGGNIATIYVNREISIDISAIGDVRAIYYNKDGEEEARVKDKSNGGFFEHEMSTFLADDEELSKAIEENRLVLDNNNWIEFDGLFVYRGKKYFIDLGLYGNVTDSNNILEAIDEVNRKGRPIYVHKKRKGYGVAFIADKDGNGGYHCFRNRFFSKKHFLRCLEEPDVDKEQCYLTRLNLFNKIKVEYGISELYGE